MLAPAGIFAHPVAGLDQRRYNGWNVARVDQVVERDREIGVGDEILAVMDDDQGIGPSRRIAGGQIDLLLAALSKRRALDLHGFDTPGGSAARLTPLGARVAVGPALRILTERIAGPRRVERIQDPFLAAVPPDRQLVFEPTAVCDGQAQQPKVGPRHPLEPGTVAARMDPSQDDRHGRPRPARRRSPPRARRAGIRGSPGNRQWPLVRAGRRPAAPRPAGAAVPAMPDRRRPTQAGSVECSCASLSCSMRRSQRDRCRAIVPAEPVR